MPTLTSWASGGWPERPDETINRSNCRLESRMRENRLYGSEGGVARTRHPYPYRFRFEPLS
jgi:hypothetical protein